MSTNLFEEHLRHTSFATKPFAQIEKEAADPDVNAFLEAALSEFAWLVDADVLQEDSDYDLEYSFDQYCEYRGFNEQIIDLLKGCLCEVSQDMWNGNLDEDLRSILRVLAQAPQPPERRYPNQTGMTPLPGEGTTKELLRQHPIDAHPDSYGNDAFDASKYKAFDREANRYGYNYTAKNDYNNQSPSRPLANPALNVNQVKTEAFEAVDSVGLGIKVHYRVLNKLTNEYVTRQIDRTQAEEIARDLNHEYRQELHESIENPNSSGQGYDEDHVHHPLHKCCQQHGFGYSHSTPIHQRDGSVLIHHTWAHGEHKVGAHEGSTHWTSKVSSGSGHSTTGNGASALAAHLENKSKRYPELRLNEQYTLPSTPITEGLLIRDDAKMNRYLQAIEKGGTFTTVDGREATTRTMGGNLLDGDRTPQVQAIADFKATALLNERVEAKFEGNTGINEQLAIRSKQQRSVPRRSEESFMLGGNEMSDKAFLDSLNANSLIEKK